MKDKPVASEVERFLRASVEAARRFQRTARGPYVCMEEFVLEHGRPFLPQRLPDDYTKGEPQQCYKNSQELIVFRHQVNGDTLTYCEGYAAGIIPVLHGWLVNQRGEVIDRTWTGKRRTSGAPLAVEYYGVPFRSDYVRRMVVKSKSWLSLIDNWEDEWPLLTKPVPVERWLATLPP